MFGNIGEQIRAMDAAAKAKAEADQVSRFNLFGTTFKNLKPIAPSIQNPVVNPEPWDAQKEASQINASKPKPEIVSGGGGLIGRYLAR